MPADTRVYDTHDDDRASYVVNAGLDTPENRAMNEQLLRLNGCRSWKHVPYLPASDPYARDDNGQPIPLPPALRSLGFLHD